MRETTYAPKYLPRLINDREPMIAEGVVERLAFVLAGIEPTERERSDLSGRTLKQLVPDSSVQRIGSSSSLRDDHQYILSFKYDFSKVDFDELWQEAKVVPTGQASTEFLKLAKSMHRFPIDTEGTELRQSKNAELIRQVQEHAPMLLYRSYRTAVRHIEEACQRPVSVPEAPFHTKLLERLGLKKKVAEPVVIDDDILKEAKTYLEDVIRLGRFLRVPRPR